MLYNKMNRNSKMYTTDMQFFLIIYKVLQTIRPPEQTTSELEFFNKI